MLSASTAQGVSPTMQSAGPPLQPHTSPNEAASKEKLASYIYEYLVHSGASKTAETFKTEVLANTQTCKSPTVSEAPPGFLLNWWLVFWDLYCAAPERRDDNPVSQEAKYFYNTFVGDNQFHAPMMNGMHGQFAGGPSPMGIPGGPEGMIPGFPGRFPPGRPGGPPGAPGMPPGAQFAMFPDPRLAQRMPPGAMAMPRTFPGLRPGGPQPTMPYGPRPGYMDSPGPAFPPGAMMPNGGVMCSQAPMSMASPSGCPPISTASGSLDPNNPENRFMMIPSSSAAMGFDPAISGPPLGAPPPMSNGGVHEATSQMGLINGDEIKQSPAGTPRGANGTGTPGAGPGSQAPGSVQSSGAAPQLNGPDTTPTDNVIPPVPTGDDEEISKIKASIFEDAKQFDGSAKPTDEPMEPYF